MISVLTAWIVVAAVLILASTAVLRRRGSPGHSLPVTAEWIEELSTDRYRPMARLLDSSEIAFLRSQAGFTPRLEADLRARRCQIFRGYLRCLDEDFKQVSTALSVLLVQPEQERPDLSAVLLHYRILFAAGMVAAHFRLFLYGRGIGSVDANRLVEIFDLMRIELRNLVPGTITVCA